jgi:hypothetical protein
VLGENEIRVNFDLGVLNDFVHRWWISACDSAHDPGGRRRMHARAGNGLHPREYTKAASSLDIDRGYEFASASVGGIRAARMAG